MINLTPVRPPRWVFGRGLNPERVASVITEEALAQEIPFVGGEYGKRGIMMIVEGRAKEYYAAKDQAAHDFLQGFRDTRSRIAKGLRKLRRARDGG